MSVIYWLCRESKESFYSHLSVLFNQEDKNNPMNKHQMKQTALQGNTDTTRQQPEIMRTEQATGRTNQKPWKRK